MSATATSKTAEADAKATVATTPQWSSAFATLIGNDFVNNQGQKLTADALKGKVFGIYFSAHWCPPCRGFTPELVKTYNLLKSQNKPFEIVFCSSDHDAGSFQGYYKTMPWLALPYADRKRKAIWDEHFQVEGIPTLVLLDGTTGEVITKNGRAAVGMDPTGKDFPWIPKPCNELNGMSVQDINEVAAVLLWAGAGDSKAQTDAIDALKAVAAKTWAKFKAAGQMPSLNFLYGKADPIVARVKQFVLPQAKPGVVLTLLDIPNGCKYLLEGKPIEELSEAVIQQFVDGYQSKKLVKIMLPRPEPEQDD